ncbi:MAG: hypothetical protein KC619_33115 [Myxococcales bacterium]|nr:hypothetical protein [Myxococcales bacterium]
MKPSNRVVVERRLPKLGPSTRAAIEAAVQTTSKQPVSVSHVGRALGVVDPEGTHVLVTPRGERAALRIARETGTARLLTVAGIAGTTALVALLAGGLAWGSRGGIDDMLPLLSMIIAPGLVFCAALFGLIAFGTHRRAKSKVNAIADAIEEAVAATTPDVRVELAEPDALEAAEVEVERARRADHA